MAIVERDGIKLFYEESGSGDPPLVFVHGWCCNHTFFAPQAEALEADHRVVSVDLRGHGQSDKPDQQYDISLFADDVAWLIGEVGLDRPVAIGHSMGGATVLQLGASHADVVRGVVMVDAAPISHLMAELLESLTASLDTDDYLAARRGVIEGMLFSPTDEADVKARVVEEMLTAPQHVALSCFGALGRWDGEAAARACAVPALHIAATPAINDSAMFASLNPAIQTAQTVGAGHFNQLLVPSQVNAMIARFLQISVG